MFKKHILVVLVAILLTVVSFSGCIQDQEVGIYPGAQEIDVDTAVISQFLDISKAEIDDAIYDLNIKMYGVNGVSKHIVLTWYENRHHWNLQKSSDTDFYSLRAWASLFDGHVVSVSGHGSLQVLVGYDVVFLTSHASLTVYAEYFDYL